MSEYEAYVACTCWRQGKTTPPPVDPTTLTLDQFGQVCPIGLPGLESSDDEDLWSWWEEHACPHRYMRLMELIWWTQEPGIGVLKHALDQHQLPAFAEVLEHGQSSCGPKIIADPALAATALDELHGFFDRIGGDREQHLKDAGWTYVELRELLLAAVETGNPLVGYHNGCSLGFDETPLAEADAQ